MTLFLTLFSLIIGIMSLPGKAEDTFIALSYHDCKDADEEAFIDTITTNEISRQFQWFKENGYHPISINDLMAAREGKKPLPSKALLLTFDDGYKSFYQVIYPLLKAYQYPALLAIVGKWIETPANQKVEYGNKKMDRSRFLTWEEMREMKASGLVEVASHSYDHHHGILGNPQGNQQPAYTTRLYLKNQQRYETQSEYEKRIDEDMKKNSTLIKKHLGKAPRIMVWPYGSYDENTLHFARKNGMPITVTLDDKGPNHPTHLNQISRYYYLRTKDLGDFVSDIREFSKKPLPIIRSIRVDMDHIYDPNPIQCEKNLSVLVDRIYKYKISAVFLQAFADPEAKGYARDLYFPNRHLPMKADLMNRVSWQLKTRSGVSIYAWIPLTAFDFHNDHLLVKTAQPQKNGESIDPHQYKRISVFSEEGKQKIRDIYEDLGAHVPLDGIAFHDDGVLTDYEDASPHGIAAQVKAGFPSSLTEIKKDKSLLNRWTRWKSKALIDFSQELKNIVKRFSPLLKTNRNLFALPVLEPESEEWFAQNMYDFLSAYDHVALMAMPYMEKNGSAPESWLLKLIEKVKMYPHGVNKTLFELQSIRWDKGNEPIDSKTLLDHMRLLSSKGVRHIGYYPDDFLKNHPDLGIVKEGISLQDIPFLQ